MLIPEQALKHWIENFYGYGSWNARYWFVSYEDGGGDLPEEVAEKINHFQKVHPATDTPSLTDIRELYRNVTFRLDGPKAELFTNRHEYRFGVNAIQNNVWKNLLTFLHSYRKQNVPDLLDYQRHKFASPSAHQEALIQLYPLPSPHNHAWYYSWLDMPNLGFLKSRALYEEHVYDRRIQTILSNIVKFKPELVLMYGMNNINTLKESIRQFHGAVKFKMIKSIKQQIPQHHRAEIGSTTLLITTQIPALRHGRVESGFDWEVFGRAVRPL
jgi:hypothetical protein